MLRGQSVFGRLGSAFGRRMYSDAKPDTGFNVESFISRIDALTNKKAPRPQNNRNRQAQGKKPEGQNGPRGPRPPRQPRQPRPEGAQAEAGANKEAGSAPRPRVPRDATKENGSQPRPPRFQNRPQGDRVQADGAKTDRPQGQRPQGQRPQGQRPQGQRPQGPRSNAAGASAAAPQPAGEAGEAAPAFPRFSSFEEDGSQKPRRRRPATARSPNGRPRKGRGRPGANGARARANGPRQRRDASAMETVDTSAFLAAEDGLKLILSRVNPDAHDKVQISSLDPRAIASSLPPSAITFNTRLWSALNNRTVPVSPEAATRFVSRTVSGEFTQDMLPEDSNPENRALDTNGTLSIEEKRFLSSVAAGSVPPNKIQQSARV